VPDERSRGRRLFGPVVLAGLIGSGLVALAGTKPWAAPAGGAGAPLVDKTGGHVPLAGALGLVSLACWGVVLVTRGLARRVVTVLGAVTAVGLVVTVVVGRGSALDSARTATLDLGQGPVTAHTTGWWWTALVGSVLVLAAALAAVRLVATWPEMGTRYDAPGAREEGTPPDPAAMDEGDLWRAIDHGRDPTDPPD
jgi:uncharacterized membrane protein (TIGR02234 family)